MEGRWSFDETIQFTCVTSNEFLAKIISKMAGNNYAKIEKKKSLRLAKPTLSSF